MRKADPFEVSFFNEELGMRNEELIVDTVTFAVGEGLAPPAVDGLIIEYTSQGEVAFASRWNRNRWKCFREQHSGA